MTPGIQKEINEVYSSYFQQPVIGIVGNLSNIGDSEPAQAPPHCDRFRKTAINYIMQTGGDNVYTCFYKKLRNNDNLSEAANSLYSEVTLDDKIKLPAKTWHAYNVQQYHSVEGITDTRLIFSLLLDSNPSLDDIEIQYPELLLK